MTPCFVLLLSFITAIMAYITLTLFSVNRYMDKISFGSFILMIVTHMGLDILSLLWLILVVMSFLLIPIAWGFYHWYLSTN